ALVTLIGQYRHGPYFRRDPQAAVQAADRVVDLAPQGPGPPSPYETRAHDLARSELGEILVMTDGFPPDQQSRGFAIVKDLFEKEKPLATTPYATALRYGRGTTA